MRRNGKGVTARVFILAVLAGLFVPQAFGSLVALYGNQGAPMGQLVQRVSSLGYSTVYWTNPSQVTSSSLSGVDVFYVGWESVHQLAAQSSLISNWVAQGKGLVVEQPNREGPIAILPPGRDISVWSHRYDLSWDVAVTPWGATHPITRGLTLGDLCSNADLVRLSDVSPAYEILGVQASDSSLVALAAAWYGQGRIVFHTGTITPASMAPGSDQYVRQMIDWAAVPEPASWMLFGAVAAALTRFRASRSKP